MGIKYYFQFFIIISLLYSLKIDTKAQDSLYLVGTIIGESNEKRITNVKGIGDINTDGYDDFMVAVNTGLNVKGQGIVKLYLGSADGNLTHDVIFHYPGKDSLYDFGGTISGVGDVNGDDYDDFIIWGLFSDWGYWKGKVFLYLGGSSIDTLPVKEFYEPWIQDSFGYITEAVGDINKDGYDDFITCSHYNWSDGKGYVYLFWGGDTISWEKCDTISGNLFFPQSAANIGDINNDGFDDIAIGTSKNPLNADSCKVYIYYGGNQVNTEPDTILFPNKDTYEFGRIIKNAGDINGNGVSHFFIVSGNYVFLYSVKNNPVTINGSLLGLGGYINIESNLNMNNDDYTDFVIGNTNYKNSDDVMVGGAFLYLGGSEIDTNYIYKLEGENKWDEFSKIMSHSDMNDDSYDEIFILAPNYPDYENPLGKVYIYSHKKFTGIKDYKGNIPNNLKLYQNYPNPFNPTTILSWQLEIRSIVKISIYDVLGREVTTILNEEQPAGEYEIEFDASEYNLSSGIYFYELSIGSFGKTKDNALHRKMVLLR